VNDKVFISYSNHDAEIANAICGAIEARGRTCWMAPRDIQPSSEWAEQIIDGINAANVMVLVFSSWSNKSPQVRREVERAINREMPVIPFRIEKVLPVKSLEYFLSTQHWFDAFGGSIDAHIARLCGLVDAVVVPRDERSRPAASDVDRMTTTDLTASFAMPPRMTETPNYRDDDLAFVARELARQIGPIARYLVQRASVASATPAAMIETLAAEFKEPKERASFMSACRQRLGL
jgi:hypothetical protein